MAWGESVREGRGTIKSKQTGIGVAQPSVGLHPRNALVAGSDDVPYGFALARIHGIQIHFRIRQPQMQKKTHRSEIIIITLPGVNEERVIRFWAFFDHRRQLDHLRAGDHDDHELTVF